MIDLEKCIKIFNNHVENYKTLDQSEKFGIQYKIDHTYRVVQYTKNICKSLNLNKNDTSVALLIALLHDIGRFEQFKMSRIYNDSKSGLNHGILGVEILKQNNFIKSFVEDKEIQMIVLESILNHNCYQIITNDKALMFAKIIRDADKLDILNDIDLDVSDEIYEISKEVEIDFFKNQLIIHNNIKNNIDFIICYISFIYDINFEYTYEYILKNHIIENKFKQIEEQTKLNMNKYKSNINLYLKERMSLC